MCIKINTMVCAYVCTCWMVWMCNCQQLTSVPSGTTMESKNKDEQHSFQVLSYCLLLMVHFINVILLLIIHFLM